MVRVDLPEAPAQRDDNSIRAELAVAAMRALLELDDLQSVQSVTLTMTATSPLVIVTTERIGGTWRNRG